MKPRNVIILAAGMGIRLRPITMKVPKALVSCAGWPLLSYSLEFARRVVDPGGTIVVVTGFQGDQVRAFVEGQEIPAKIATNPDFDKANLLSVGAGLDKVDGDFLLMNVDHIYPFAFAGRLVDASGDIVAAVDSDRVLGDDDMKVRLADGAAVKAISKTLGVFDCGYIGMTLVRGEGVDAYREAFEKAKQRFGDKAVAEDVLQVLADSGSRVDTCDLSGLRWLEVDTPDDLESSECVLMDDPGLLLSDWDE